MPIQTPQWTEFLTCPICYNEFEDRLRQPISLGCGHTMCKACLSQLHKTQCPFDQATVNMDINKLPVNTALLQLVGVSVTDYPLPDIPSIKENASQYSAAMECIEELALYLSCSSSGSLPGANGTSGMASNTTLTRPMQRKLVTLVNCQLAEEEGRTRAMRAARSLGERTVTELILLHQNPQQLSANLWAAVRARGCQFLGPAMQEEALKLILLALEGGESLSRKVLVLFVVQRLEPDYPQASKTSIGHVVQLLYRASCFKVTKRDDDSSLMQLKEQFRTYDSLRKEHDAQVVQIAMEAGLRISPDQWASLLYGELEKKSHMQSIIDKVKLQSPSSFSQSIQELIISLQRSSDPGELSRLRTHFELLSEIDTAPDAEAPSWEDLEKAMQGVLAVVQGLVSFSKMYGSKMKGSTDPPQPNHNFSRFKTSMCRDYQKLGGCPRGASCSFAHSEEELDKYGGRGQRRPPTLKPKGTVVARGPSEQYLPLENGSAEPAISVVTQASQMNGSARSSPLCVSRPQGEMAQPGFSPTQPQYSRSNPESMTQRMKQMTMYDGGSYAASPPYDRVPYTNGSERNNYYNGPYYGQSAPLTVAPPINGTPYAVMTHADLKGQSVPQPGVLTPRSSPQTIQDDTMNGSRDNGMTNGHSDPVRRQPSRIPYDPRRPRVAAPGYQYDPAFGGYSTDPYYSAQSTDYYPGFNRYEQVAPVQTIGYAAVPTCRRDVNQFEYYQHAVPPQGMFDGFHGDGMMNGIAMNGRYRDDGRLQRRSPYIPSDSETTDSPRSDFGDRDDLAERHFDDWLRDLKTLRKDTTSSSGVSSGSPLSHSPAASQSSISSLSPRQDSPLGWQHNSDSDKIWQNYFSENGTIRPPPGITTPSSYMSPLLMSPHKEREVRKLWLSDRNHDQIAKDEQFARELQEAENGSGSSSSSSPPDTKTLQSMTTNDIAIVKALSQFETDEVDTGRRQREHEEKERAKARREQEEKDCKLAIKTQVLEQCNEMQRRKKLEHERLLMQRRRLLQKQSKETQEQSDLRLAKQIVLEDVKNAGYIFKPIGYKPNLITRGPSATCPQHGNEAAFSSPFGRIMGLRNGCGPSFADDDILEAPKIGPACTGDIYVQE